MRFKRLVSLALIVLMGLSFLLLTAKVRAKQTPAFTRKEDVVYGRKYGTALTMDVITPTSGANGLGVIWVISGGWVSSHDGINPASVGELLRRGYTVFAVVHGCQPKFTIPEILGDMNRSVRFIRFHAADYGIDPNRIGITGASAGGHLSLMQGTAGDLGNPSAKDPIDRVSSRVQAVACFFPPTDFLNYGKTGNVADGHGTLKAFRPPFDFHEANPAQGGTFERITDPAKLHEILVKISPIDQVTPDDAPSLMIHGDADPLVPIQQSEIMVAKLKEAGVPAQLIVHKGGQHGWPDMGNDMPKLADWFDQYLKK